MKEKKLGKITGLSIGFGGYDDAMFGASFSLGNEGWGISDFWGTWAERPADAKWSVADQDSHFSDVIRRLMALCRAAKVDSVENLIGKPVEIIIENDRLKSWRILTEVC